MRFCGALTLALLAVKANALSTWIRVSSSTAEIFTDGGESSARAILLRFETLNRIFSESNIAESPPRLRVFIFASERDFDKYRPRKATAGFYGNSGDEDLSFFWKEAS